MFSWSKIWIPNGLTCVIFVRLVRLVRLVTLATCDTLWKLMTFLTIENRQNIHSFIQSYTGQHSQFLQCVKWSTLVQIVKTIQCFSWSLLSRANFALVVDILPNPSMFAKLSGSVGRWPGWPCTTTRSKKSTPTPSMDSPSKSTRHSPSPCFQSFSAFTTFLVEFHKFNGEWNVFCFFIELQWKGWEPYPALCYSRSAQCLPHALSVPLFCLGDRPKLFGIFTPEFSCNSNF